MVRDNFNEGTRISVTYPTGVVREHPSVLAFVKKFFRGNKQIGKDINKQLRDRDTTEYQGYSIRRIKPTLNQ